MHFRLYRLGVSLFCKYQNITPCVEINSKNHKNKAPNMHKYFEQKSLKFSENSLQYHTIKGQHIYMYTKERVPLLKH